MRTAAHEVHAIDVFKTIARPQVEELIEGILRPLPVTELVAILRQPSCFGPSEKAALHALGRRAGQRFDDVWQAVRWLHENRPDINLAGPAS